MPTLERDSIPVNRIFIMDFDFKQTSIDKDGFFFIKNVRAVPFVKNGGIIYTIDHIRMKNIKISEEIQIASKENELLRIQMIVRSYKYKRVNGTLGIGFELVDLNAATVYKVLKEYANLVKHVKSVNPTRFLTEECYDWCVKLKNLCGSDCPEAFLDYIATYRYARGSMIRHITIKQKRIVNKSKKGFAISC